MNNLTEAKTAHEVIRWLVDTPHHEGYAYGPTDKPDGLALRGRNKELRIPRGLVPESWMQPSNFDETGRMFEPTEAGRLALAEQEGREDG